MKGPLACLFLPIQPLGQSVKRVVWPCFLCHERHLGRIKQTLAKQLLEEFELAVEPYFVQSESDDHCKLGNIDSAHIKRISQHPPTPPSSKSIHSTGRGSQHLANSEIPEVQKATLSRGTCNPFIQSYVFIFWILCVTYTALVCFVSFSVSAQTSLFHIAQTKWDAVVWFRQDQRRDLAHSDSWCATIAAVKSVNTGPLPEPLGCFQMQGSAGASSAPETSLGLSYSYRSWLIEMHPQINTEVNRDPLLEPPQILSAWLYQQYEPTGKTCKGGAWSVRICAVVTRSSRAFRNAPLYRNSTCPVRPVTALLLQTLLKPNSVPAGVSQLLRVLCLSLPCLFSSWKTPEWLIKIYLFDVHWEKDNNQMHWRVFGWRELWRGFFFVQIQFGWETKDRQRHREMVEEMLCGLADTGPVRHY